MNIRPYLQISPVNTPGGAAASYVPAVVLSRALAFIRLLLVARLLGDAGKTEFGLYQPAQELVNWIVPLALFGLADVAERYAARFEKEGRLRPWLRRHYQRLLATALLIGTLLTLLAPWLGPALLHMPPDNPARSIALLAECALTIAALALYQHLAAILRGVRAYAASAGLELGAALLFLLFAAIAAWRGGALALMAAYALSLLLAVAYYGIQLASFLRRTEPAPAPSPQNAPHTFNRFAAWTFLRLLLMMTFSAVSVLGVGYLASHNASNATADYTMANRIAQLLSYVAITLWSSTYGIAARAWSHGQFRRAHLQLFRVGKWAALLLTAILIAALLLRDLLGLLVGPYAQPIHTLLPPLLAVFLWYALLAFWTLYADLHERPALGAALWASAVLLQLASLLALPLIHPLPQNPGALMALACGLGLLATHSLVLPLTLWQLQKRLPRPTAATLPILLLTLAPATLFVPTHLLLLIALPTLLAAIAFLFVSGLLVRPIDRRAWRRWRSRHARTIFRTR